MYYTDFSTLFDDICKNKQNIVKLSLMELYLFKRDFYKLPFSEWKLNLLWEYVWSDKSYSEIFYILTKSKK